MAAQVVRATLVKAALSGEHDLASQFVTLNAGAAIYVGGGSQTLSGGIALAEDVIASSAATEKLRLAATMSASARSAKALDQP